MDKIINDISYMPLMLVVCVLLWEALTFLFKRYLNKSDNKQSEIVKQQQETNNILTDIRCDLRSSIERISNHDKDIKNLRLTDKELCQKVNDHETRIQLLEKNN